MVPATAAPYHVIVHISLIPTGVMCELARFLQCHQQFLEVCWQGAFECHANAAYGMTETQ